METSVFQFAQPLSGNESAMYIARSADQEIAARLHQREYLLVIEPPRQGKTSLLHALRRDPVLSNMDFIYLDCANPAFERSSEAGWYSSVAAYINRQVKTLGYPLTPLSNNAQQWKEFLIQMATFADQSNRPLVLLCDQVGAPLPDTLGFFGAMRAVYSARYNNPALKNLCVVLAGAFDPKNLMQDQRISPFNIADRVHLENLTFNQVWRLMQAGGWQVEQLYALAQQVYSWTNGQPYLTQLLCSRLGLDPTLESINSLAQDLISDEDYFSLILKSLQELPDLVEYLEQIYKGEKIEFFPRHIRKQSRLELLGMIQGNDQGYCQFNSRLHEQIYLQVKVNLNFTLGMKVSGDSSAAGSQPVTAGGSASKSRGSTPKVNVHLFNRIYPTAYSHYLTSQDDFPFVIVEIDNSAPDSIDTTLEVSAMIQGESYEVNELISLLSGEKKSLPLFPILTHNTMRSLTNIRIGSLQVHVEQLNPDKQLLYKRTEKIYLQAQDVALLGVQQPNSPMSDIDLTDYLSAWVTYQNREVEIWLRKAANRHPQHSIVGYQGSGDRAHRATIVREQVKAIYDTLKYDLELTYIDASLSLGAKDGQISQRVRLPKQSLAVKSANCIDATVLFASLFAAASIRPILAIVPGHAFVGWRIWDNLDECEFLETTMVNSHDFDAAWRVGQERFNEVKDAGYLGNKLFDPKGFARCIDVMACYERGIYPFSS